MYVTDNPGFWVADFLFKFHMGIRDIFMDRNKCIKVLAKLSQGIYSGDPKTGHSNTGRFRCPVFEWSTI